VAPAATAELGVRLLKHVHAFRQAVEDWNAPGLGVAVKLHLRQPDVRGVRAPAAAGPAGHAPTFFADGQAQAQPEHAAPPTQAPEGVYLLTRV
jgi:hypothetical protein